MTQQEIWLDQDEEMEEDGPPPVSFVERAKYTALAATVLGGGLELMGTGVTGLILAGVGASAVAYFSPEIKESLERHFGPKVEKASARIDWRRLASKQYLRRVPERHQPKVDSSLLEEKSAPQKQRGGEPEPLDRSEVSFELDGEEDLPLPPGGSSLFLFSEVLTRFAPSLEQIFLARTPDGMMLTCHVRDLCHVALAGNTGGGKSSILRLLLVQLVYARVRVLLLNPHYTGYDMENGEDWTPFEPYLVHPPMQCRAYPVIEHYLRSVAKTVIPARLDRRAQSQPVGAPYFLVIDELPSIVREIKAAPEYMRIILEEGRKVGVFLISAAQDFLVRTISPSAGGGSIRECYRTTYYVGGDPTTARTLLDMPANHIKEDELGKGVVMLRSAVTKKAIQVQVPYVDNAALYQLLGPSTYVPASTITVPEQELSFPTISGKERSGNSGNGQGNGVEMTQQASSEKVIAGVFPFPGKEMEQASRSALPVTDEKLEMIRQMKERNYQDSEIASLVRLSGRKYQIYKQCLLYLGYTSAKEG